MVSGGSAKHQGRFIGSKRRQSKAYEICEGECVREGREGEEGDWGVSTLQRRDKLGD